VETESPRVATHNEIVNLRSRPLAIPAVEEGSGCPGTTSTRRPDRDLGPILGTGPAGPVGLIPGAVLRFVGPDEHPEWGGSAWGGQKVLWAVDPGLATPVLVRGRQLDGPHQVRFNDPASPELILDPQETDGQGPGWRDYPAHTRLQAPGATRIKSTTPRGHQ
jgi:hypothetical protein